MTQIIHRKTRRRDARQRHQSYLQLLVADLIGLPRIDPFDDVTDRSTHRQTPYRNPNLW